MARIELGNRRRESIDYTLTLPAGPGKPETVVIYLHGFASDQQGEKVLYLRDRFVENGTAFLAFDHRGHGVSDGTMREWTLTRNLEDVGAIFKAVAGDFKKRVLIGSSMGGQTAAWFTLRNPGMVTANLLIAPSFTFLENRRRELGARGLKRLKTLGEYTVKNRWIEVTVGIQCLRDAERYTLDRLVRRYRTPTLILHGTEDDAVPCGVSLEFLKKAKARPLEVLLIGGGDHRLTAHKQVLFSHMAAFCRQLGIL